MIDPIFAMTKSLLPIPVPTHTHTSTSSVHPIPTVVPGPSIDVQEVGDAGKRTLWVVCILMGLSSLAFMAMSYRVPVQKRLFHVMTTMITTFAFLSYFAMATGDGNSFVEFMIKDKHHHTPDTHTYVQRQVFWARYVDWAVTTPLLLLDLAFLCGMNGSNMVVAIVADVIMVLTGMFAAFGTHGGQKWGWYTIGCIAYLVIVHQLVVAGRRNAATRDTKVANFYTAIAGFTLILWTAYPIVWGIGDGARKMSVDSEIMAYAILDVLAKPVFGAWLLITHAKLPAMSVPLTGAWATGFTDREGTLRVGDDDE